MDGWYYTETPSEQTPKRPSFERWVYRRMPVLYAPARR